MCAVQHHAVHTQWVLADFAVELVGVVLADGDFKVRLSLCLDLVDEEVLGEF
jgi:hypothetical protein